MNNQITKENVIEVADSISIKLTDDQINEVLEMYPYDQEQDPTATWDLVVENIIYSITL